MRFLPISLSIRNKKILVVGGGRVALQKLKTLIQYAHEIRVCAPDIIPEMRQMPVSIIDSGYDEKFLADVHLVYACTNDSDLNSKIKANAATRGILCCVADNPDECDFVSPAVYKSGNISVAVSSDGKDVKKAIEIRDKIKSSLSDI